MVERQPVTLVAGDRYSYGPPNNKYLNSIMEFQMEKLASRRFIVAILVLLISTALVYTGKIEAANFENIVVWISGIYIVGKPVGDIMTKMISTSRQSEIPGK